MTNNHNHISKLNQFLIDNASANDADSIKNAKCLYLNRQKALWRQQQRKETKSITVTFSLREYGSVTAHAKRHSLSRTQYVHHATLAYGKGGVVQLSDNAINTIRESYLLTCHALIDLHDDNKMPEQAATIALHSLEKLADLVNQELQNPNRIEAAIRDFLQRTPEQRHIIIDLLKTL